MTDATFSPSVTEGDRRSNGAWTTFLLGLCMFTTGGAGLVVEYVMATTTTFILGSSIIVWSLVIGVMLGAMGFSGFLQKHVGDTRLLEKFFAIEVTLAIAGGFAPIGLFWAYDALNEHFNLVLYSWTILIGLLIGLEIPVVMRLIEQRGINLKTNLMTVFGADYAGAMVFMFVWVYLLLPNVPITEVGFIVSGLNFLVALVAVIYFGRLGGFQHGRVVTIVALAAATLVGYGYFENRTWSVHLEQRLYEDPIVYQETSRYQHLVITRASVSRCGEEFRLYINGHTQFGSCDEDVYHDNLVHPVMSLVPHRRHVLILGGGDGLALREVLKYEPAQVTLVDLDPDMVKIARDNPILNRLNHNAFANTRVLTPDTLGVAQEGGLFQTVTMGTGQYDAATGLEITERVADVRRMHIDAGKFLELVNDQYDVIIVDLPDPSSVEISKLYSTAFYQHLRTRLTADGVVVVQATSPVHAREVYLEIGRTMRASGLQTIGLHDNVPSFGEWGFWIGCRRVGCSGRLRERLRTLEAFTVPTTYLTPARLRANLEFALVDGVPFFDSAEGDQVNTLTNPTLFMRYENDAWKSY